MATDRRGVGHGGCRKIMLTKKPLRCLGHPGAGQILCWRTDVSKSTAPSAASEATKRCTVCKQYLPLDSFCKSKLRVDGLHYECRLCVREQRIRRKRASNPDYVPRPFQRFQSRCARCKKRYDREYYESNKAELLVKQREYLRSLPPETRKQRTDRVREKLRSQAEQQRAYFRNRYKKQRDRLLAQRQAYRDRNRDRMRAYFKQWHAKHDGYASIQRQRRRVLMMNGNPVLTVEQWRFIKRAFGYRCAYCGEKKALTMDHVIPLIRGGKHEMSNIVPACRSCNASKGPRDAPPFHSDLVHVRLELTSAHD